MISQKTIKTLSLALLSAGLLASCSSSSSSKATEEQSADTVRLVEVAPAEMRALNLSEEFTAQLEAKVVNNITAQAGGRLKQLLVKVGDRVGAGQAVARMEATQASQAQIQLADAKTNFARMDELYKVGGVSKAQWEQAKSAVDQAKLAYGNAAENTVLRSPISGFVTAKNYDNGDMTSPQLPVVVIQQIAPVKAVIGVSEQYYSYLKKGAAATLSVDALGEETFSGIVTNIFPTLDPVTHTVSTEIEVANKDLKLRPGMYARVHLDFGTKEALTVPDKAIVRQAGSGARYVYVFSGGKAVYRAVELGQQQGDLYEVVSGLNAGDQVITSAPSNLKNGLSVKLRK
ncbi:efflux RND transporter periplasmic adaptor subunit [Porphyromonas sp.]|jgi:efflux transporter, RND family, MFP subunit|uniref:efflux RND transporter periplasmic adaptor subunit n=1 Tax=Porphyromonas sp. TaxID=1924944 RepID=UPI001CB45D36|nr:efflux RND transporter periplasmic adaptor subunit [Porphyromonas sp.]MBF1380904.1 efflux RND transporter periplasmic adaptor subunit [Porphyromonadaceae bacterium]MBF1382889.1 efflux RND transporter periplasmic adaptor subunit [Porphyromonas sp.]